MAPQYGEVRVDYITYTTGVSPNEGNATIYVSGLVNKPTFSGDVVIKGELTVEGDIVASGDVTFDQGLTVSGNTNLNTLTVTGNSQIDDLFVGNDATVTGNTNLKGNLVVGGTTTVTGISTFIADGYFSSGLYVSNNATVTGILSVEGTISGDVINAGSGTAAAPSVSVGTTDNGLYSPGTDQVAISTNGTQALYINADGNILVADGNRMEIDEVRARDGAGLKLFDDAGAGIFVEDGGNVGIGTSSPSAKLGVNGSATFADDIGIGGTLPASPNISLNADGTATFAGDLTISDKIIHNGDTNTAVRFPANDTVSVETAGTERLRIASTGAMGLSGANYGTAGQVLVSNGSSAAPTWEQITSSAVFGWDHDDDTYGLYLPGTSIKASDLTGTVDIDVQSRMRRCVINDAGAVQYYLDADDSDMKAGDWLRIIETEALDTAYTGTISESTNSSLRVGVPAWAANTFTLGQRVTNGGYLWECLAATSTATPAAGAVASDLTGADGQVVVEVPAFSVRYGFLNGVHTREVRLGCNDGLIAQGFRPHTAFIKTDGTYKSAFYFGAYHTYDDAGTGSSVSGQTNTRSQTRAVFRSEAAARGTGWHVLSYLELAAIQTLIVCEFQDYNSQKSIGNGSNAGSTVGVTTGQSNGDGNHSANSTGNGAVADDYMSYRGIENLYGRARQFVDGMNIYERAVYLTNDQTAFADNTADGYDFYAQVPTGSASFQKELFPLADVFLPSVVTGASSTTYLGDAFWSSTGWRVARGGGVSSLGAQVGAFFLNLNGASATSDASTGSRLAYAEN
jgi:cytoskeletal protein CcmA (bactofilin family)